MATFGYWQKLAERRISRRRALAAGAAAGLGAVGVALGACGSKEKVVGSSTAPNQGTPVASVLTALPQGTPVPGGKVTIGWPVDPGSLDPQRSATSFQISPRIHNPLHAFNMATQEFMPLVAEKLEQPDPDRLTYIWTLRKGARFHNVDPTFGREVNAEDVVYSFDRLKAGPTQSDRKLLTLRAEGYEAVDSGTFRLRTKIPFSPTLNQTGSVAYSILPREAVEKWGGELANNASGCGAWILDSAVRGERVVLRKNPDYYISGRPFPDEEEWQVIPDTGSHWQYYKTGKLDLVGLNVDKFKRQEIEGDPRFQIVEYPYLYTLVCYVRVDRPPLNDPRVREALDMAIDRDDVIDKMYFGEGNFNGPIPWPLEYWALPQEEIRAALKYDPEKARQLLAAAGHADGLEINCPIPTFGEVPEMATIIADHYRKVGVDVKILPAELAVYFAQYEWVGNYDITIFVNQPYMEPDIILRSYYSKGANSDKNPGGTNDPEVDALIEGLWGIFDQEERREAVMDTQRTLLAKHSPMFALCSPRGFAGFSSRMRGTWGGATGLIGMLGINYWVEG
jgi:peptide/nickel transport system substrate-binding protein